MTVVTFILGGGAAGIGVLIGALVSLRMLKANNAKVVAQTRSIVASDQDALLARYRQLVTDQDAQLVVCHDRIDDLERREDECERRGRETEKRAEQAETRARNAAERAVELAERVKHLEDVLREHGLNFN